MRGVVSLAAALSIPVQLSDGHPFPQRNLILFITFIVILLTLLIQGLTLPYVLRKIKLPDFGDNLPEEEAENIIRKELAEQALSHLGSAYSEQLKDQPALQQMAAKWASQKSFSAGIKAGSVYVVARLRYMRQVLNVSAN